MILHAHAHALALVQMLHIERWALARSLARVCNVHLFTCDELTCTKRCLLYMWIVDALHSQWLINGRCLCVAISDFRFLTAQLVSLFVAGAAAQRAHSIKWYNAHLRCTHRRNQFEMDCARKAIAVSASGQNMRKSLNKNIT